MGCIDVSILILTYNSDLEKTKATIKSCLLQKDILMQIVVTDDGSKRNDLSMLTEVFSEFGFENYILKRNTINEGIVKNVLNGLSDCTGEYIKLLSPGDYINGEYALCKWVDYARREKLSVIGTGYICYRLDSNGREIALKEKASPFVIGNSSDKIRKSYLLWGNCFAGPAVMCERVPFIRGISLLPNGVKYADDTTYWIMAYVGDKMGYLDDDLILYEYGTGISADEKKLKWKKVLDNELTMVTDSMEHIDIDNQKLANKFKRVNAVRRKYEQYNIFTKILNLFRYMSIDMDIVFGKVVMKWRPRYTRTNLSMEWLERIK